MRQSECRARKVKINWYKIKLMERVADEKRYHRKKGRTITGTIQIQLVLKLKLISPQ
jgi:hypothetical protein